jgi:hypothetical protein
MAANSVTFRSFPMIFRALCTLFRRLFVMARRTQALHVGLVKCRASVLELNDVINNSRSDWTTSQPTPGTQRMFSDVPVAKAPPTNRQIKAVSYLRRGRPLVLMAKGTASGGKA